jgi:hypothetical protein
MIIKSRDELSFSCDECEDEIDTDPDANLYASPAERF